MLNDNLEKDYMPSDHIKVKKKGNDHVFYITTHTSESVTVGECLVIVLLGIKCSEEGIHLCPKLLECCHLI